MDWERIENARNRARSIFGITFVAITLVVFAASAPASPGPSSRFNQPNPAVADMSLTTLTVAVGIFGVLVGLAWMWRIYRAPMRYQGAHWRFHDD